jgi:hypothetical protein
MCAVDNGARTYLNSLNVRHCEGECVDWSVKQEKI